MPDDALDGFEEWLIKYYGQLPMDSQTAIDARRAWQAATEHAARVDDAEAERIKHTSHADGLGMGRQCCEQTCKRNAAAIRRLERAPVVKDNTKHDS